MNSFKPIYTCTSILKDLFLIIFVFCNEFKSIFNTYPNLLIVFCLTAYWILFNYILGQYEANFDKLKTKIISNGFNTILILVSANIIYILINLITDKVNLSIVDFFIYINIIFKIFMYIFITQVILDIFIKQRITETNKWIIISTEERYKKLIKINSEFKNNFKIIWFENYKINNNFDDFKGIIIDDNISSDYKDLKIYPQIKKKNLEIINILKWLEKYFQISPSELHSFNDIFTLKSNLNFNNINFRIKRIGDIFLSLFLIISLLPFIIIILISLQIVQGNPLFYSQVRNGLNGKVIKIIKFRTMIINAEKDGPQWSIKNDKRVTLLGKFLRKFRLDELPQLINVIKGDMSLIGPRPERPEFDKELSKSIINYNFRYSVKPGLSGWAQVNYHYSSNINETINKLNYDIYYIKYQSIYLDFIILFKTLKIIFNARGWVSK